MPTPTAQRQVHLETIETIADYYTQGPRSFFRLHEKGGRYNVVPAHRTAQAYVDAYLEAAGIGDARRGPLFRSCERGRSDALLHGKLPSH